MSRNMVDSRSLGAVQKSPSSKATNGLIGPEGPYRCLTRGAYWFYMSTGTWRERRWRIFSTDQLWNLNLLEGH